MKTITLAPSTLSWISNLSVWLRWQNAEDLCFTCLLFSIMGCFHKKKGARTNTSTEYFQLNLATAN